MSRDKGRKEEETAANGDGDLEQEEPLFTDSRIVNVYNYRRNLYADYPKTLKLELTYEIVWRPKNLNLFYLV